MQPTLVIMAAGMGSRYGGLKQFDGLGPNGETIMDYSIYDALRAGFGKIVFVIRESFREEFDRVCGALRIAFPFEFVTQNYRIYPLHILLLRAGKTLGTGHALLATSKCVNTPFGIINADDFYGRNAFAVLAEFLKRKDLTRGSYAMIGYRLENTLSPSGPVSRGICRMDESGLLTDVVERFKIRKQENGQIVCDIPAKEGETVSMELDADDLCSMNCWGFLPDVYQKAEHLVKKFLANHVHEATSEYHLPTLVNDIIKTGEGTCRIHRSNSHWFGVTYREDRDGVVARLVKLHREGLYPDPLFP